MPPCEANLRPRDLGYYLGGVGLYAMNAGDLITAREYMRMAISFYRGTGDSRNLAIDLINFSECLEVLGEIDGAAAAATESLSAASDRRRRMAVGPYRPREPSAGWRR